MNRSPNHSNPKVRPDDARGTPKGAGAMVPAHGWGRIGNPPHVPTDEQRARVRELAKLNPPQNEKYIAATMGFSLNTLRQHYAEDMIAGRAEVQNQLAAQMLRLALTGKCEGDVTALQFYLRNFFGWTGKIVIETARPPQVADLEGVSTDELRDALPALQAIAQRLRERQPEQVDENSLRRIN